MKKTLLIGFPALLVMLLVGQGFSSEERNRIRIVNQDLPMMSPGNVRLGIVVSEISPHLRQALKIDSGVLVEEVLDESPAQEAGIHEGDIILKVAGDTVNSQKDVRQSLQSLRDNEVVEVQILRDGEPLTVQVKPEKNEIREVIRLGGRNYIGVQLQELDTDLAAYFKVDPKAGVLVTGVEPDSPAAVAGIRSGDVLTHFNGNKIDSPDEVREDVGELKDGETAEITLVRQGIEKKVTVKPENRPFHGEFMKHLPDMMAFTESPEFQEQMENLQSEMEEVKRDLQLRQQDIEELKAKIQKELESLKEELQKQ